MLTITLEGIQEEKIKAICKEKETRCLDLFMN